MIVPVIGVGSLPPPVKDDVTTAAVKSDDIAAVMEKLNSQYKDAINAQGPAYEKIWKQEEADRVIVNQADKNRLDARRDYDATKTAYEADPTPAKGKAKEEAEQKLIAAHDAFDKAESKYK